MYVGNMFSKSDSEHKLEGQWKFNDVAQMLFSI